MTENISKIIEDTIAMREKTGYVRPDMINVLIETKKATKTNNTEDNTLESVIVVPRHIFFYFVIILNHRYFNLYQSTRVIF